MKNRILIVEDELIAAEYLKSILEAHGMEVLGIIDRGKEAVEKALVLKPDIVFMDIMLKDEISGAEAAVAISKANTDIAMIFLSAYSNADILDYAVESNSYGYLMKPYKEDEIISTLKVVTAKLKREQKVTGTSQTLADTVRLSPELYYDRTLGRMFRNNEELPLGSVALRLVELLCQTPNRSVSLEQINHYVWNQQMSATTLRTLVYRIRQQCGVACIVNFSGVGYMIKTQQP